MISNIKNYILKPFYELIFNISPDLADFIEKIIYKLIARNVKKKLVLKQYLCIDLSVVQKHDNKTGIQRVVNNIYKEVLNVRKNILGTQLYNGKIVIENLTSGNKKDLLQIELDDSSHMLFLDSAWNYYRDAKFVLNKCKLKNIKTSVVIYDMFPIMYPEWFPSNHFKWVYYKWCKLFFSEVNNIICISKKVADDVIQFYKNENISRTKELNIYYIPMGANLLADLNSIDIHIRDEIKKIFLIPTFIMVGTVEPRKGHNIVIEAFKKLLDFNVNAQILIIGKDGWSNQTFKNRLQKNIYYNKKIFWYQDITDVELKFCYKHAKALIAASIDEGYGLPIVEAAYCGLPIICSDIPIFKEITQGYAIYFPVSNPEALAYTIKNCLHTDMYIDSSKIKIYSWREVTDLLLDIIDDKTCPYQIIK